MLHQSHHITYTSYQSYKMIHPTMMLMHRLVVLHRHKLGAVGRLGGKLESVKLNNTGLVRSVRVGKSSVGGDGFVSMGAWV